MPSARQPEEPRSGSRSRRSPRVLILGIFATLVVLLMIFIFLVQWVGK